MRSPRGSRPRCTTGGNPRSPEPVVATRRYVLVVTKAPDADLDPVARISWLRAEIARHDEAYYGRDAPTIPDADYDELMRELRTHRGRAPRLDHPRQPDPAARSRGGVGVTTSAAESGLHAGQPETFAAVQHAVPMMSLDNAMDAEELRAWGERTAKRLAEAGLRGRRPLHLRAEDRRPGGVDPLGARLATSAPPPGAMAHRRGRDRQRRRHRVGAPRSCAATPPAVLEARGEIYLPLAAFEELVARTEAENEAARPPGASHDRCRSTLATPGPAACARRIVGHRRPWTVLVVLPARRDRRAPRHRRRTPRRSLAAGSRPAGQPADRDLRHASTRCTTSVSTGSSTATSCHTRSTASW